MDDTPLLLLRTARDVNASNGALEPPDPLTVGSSQDLAPEDLIEV